MVDKTQFENVDKSKHGKLIEFMNTSFRSLEIAGKNVIQTNDGEFIEYVLMEEDYFVKNWLTQFAIGHVGEKNYFNHTEWSRITSGFTKGAIILNTDKQPVCLVRKFIDMDLSYNQQHYMTSHARLASQAAHIPDKSEADGLIANFAQAVDIITGQNPDYDTLTSMIPMEYYLRHGVNPDVVKQVIYIRDTYSIDGAPIEPDCDLIKEVEVILYKHSREEKVTAQEKAIVTNLTNGEFVFDGDPNKVEDKTQQPEDEAQEFDPLAD